MSIPDRLSHADRHVGDGRRLHSVGLNDSAAGEFTFTLFVVIAVSLVVSWIVAVLFTPLLGVTLLPATMKGHHETGKSFSRAASTRVLDVCMAHRWLTIGATLGVFALALAGMGFVAAAVLSQLRPSGADRRLEPAAERLDQPTPTRRWRGSSAKCSPTSRTSTTGPPMSGEGAPRFVLSFDVQPADVAFGQTVILTRSIKARDRLRAKYQA